MATIRAADGGYLLNSDQFNYTKDAQGRPVLNVKGVAGAGDASGDFKSDGTVPMSGNLYMNGNNIMGVKSISNTDKRKNIMGNLLHNDIYLNNIISKFNTAHRYL